MSAIINGSSPSVTFSDGTTQATSAIVSGYVPYANLPAGSVLQVVSANYSTDSTNTSSTFTATGLSASITPKFSTSKILVIATVPANSSTAGNSNLMTIYRNSATNLANSGSVQGFCQLYAGSSNTYAAIGMSFLDSPATTSSTNYKVYYASGNNSNIVTVFPNGETGTITLLEIAA